MCIECKLTSHIRELRVWRQPSVEGVLAEHDHALQRSPHPLDRTAACQPVQA